MKMQIKGRNVTVTPALQDYANEKIEHVHKLLLQRRIDEVTRVELELKVEKNPSIPEPCVAEATVFTRGPVIRARETSTDMYAAIDLGRTSWCAAPRSSTTRSTARRGTAMRSRPSMRRRLPELAPVAAATALAERDRRRDETEHSGDNGRIVKTKQFALKPMSVNEATLQMELVGHGFFVFTNAESNRTNVVYRRNDGHYGLIEPGRRLSSRRVRVAARVR